MANIHKGETELKSGDETYVLRYSIDAICSLENKLDKGLPVIALEMGDPAKMRLSMIREILLAGLRENHPDITLKEAGELIVSAGGAVVVLGKIGEAFSASFPEASGTKSPRKRANGQHPTGSPS